MIQHNRPSLCKRDSDSVAACLASRQIGSGVRANALEESFTRVFKEGSGVATSSGSAALYLALRSSGVRAGQAVLLPSYACTALLDAVLLLNAKPIICDVEPASFNISKKEALEAVEREDIAAVVVVHTFGRRVPEETIALLRQQTIVIEDCCHSLGAEFASGTLGLGDVSIYSFYATKMLAASEGGLLWSRSDQIALDAKGFLDTNWHSSGPNFNLRMSDLCASLLDSQITKLWSFVEKRRQLDNLYREALGASSAAALPLASGDVPYRFVLLPKSEALRDRIHKLCLSRGVETSKLFSARELLHNVWERSRGKCPEAEQLSRRSLSIPCFPDLSTEESKIIAETLQEIDSIYGDQLTSD